MVVSIKTTILNLVRTTRYYKMSNVVITIWLTATKYPYFK